MTASLPKSSGLFSIFWPILIKLAWMESTCPLISRSSSPLTNPYGILATTVGNQRHQTVCLGFTSKQTKSFPDWHPHTQKTNATHSVTTFFFESFSHQRFHWSLRDNKSPQVSRTLPSILTDLNNAGVWRVSTRPVISSPPVLVLILS